MWIDPGDGGQPYLVLHPVSQDPLPGVVRVMGGSPTLYSTLSLSLSQDPIPGVAWVTGVSPTLYSTLSLSLSQDPLPGVARVMGVSPTLYSTLSPRTLSQE